MISGRFKGGDRGGGRKGGCSPRSPPVSATDYQSRSDCTRPEAVMGVDTGGGLGVPGVLPPEIFLICECPHVQFLVRKGHILARKV